MVDDDMCQEYNQGNEKKTCIVSWHYFWQTADTSKVVENFVKQHLWLFP